jgi:hypothetical protein
MKKFLVPVAVAAAALGNANAYMNQEHSERGGANIYNGAVSEDKDQPSNALASLLMIPAVANIDTITQLPQHRSHSSHGSHRSHYSSRY